MKMQFLNWPFIKYLQKHEFWLTPLFTGSSIIFGASITYIIPAAFEKLHPIRAEIIGKILLYKWPILIISVTIIIILAFIKGFSQRSVLHLEQELQEEKEKSSLIAENIRNLFEGYLFRFATTTLFSEDNKHDRITLYIHIDNKFIPCGRFSTNPTYSAAGRESYPDTEGCISKAWENLWYYEVLPADKSKRHTILKERFKIPKSTYTKFKMVSLTYAAMRVTCSNGKNHAVIVVESTEADRFVEKDIKNKLESQIEYIAELVTALKAHIPNPSLASKGGF